MAPVKVLMCGDVRGRLDDLSTRVNTLQKSAHGPFDVIFCTGEFLPPSDIDQDGLDKFTTQARAFDAMPLYFVSQDVERAKGLNAELGDNVHFLGAIASSGIESVCGLAVAHVSGLDSTWDPQTVAPTISSPVLKVDILLTCQWPRELWTDAVTAGKAGAAPTDGLSGSAKVTALALTCSPRYHFVGTNGVYFQRAPYRNAVGRPVTRFQALAVVDAAAPKERKWLTALRLDPVNAQTTSQLEQEPANTTQNPYVTLPLLPPTSATLTPATAGLPPSMNMPPGQPPMLMPLKRSLDYGMIDGGGVPGGLSAEQVARLQHEQGGSSSQFFYGAKGGGFRADRGRGRGGRGGRGGGRGGEGGPPRKKRIPARNKVAPRMDCWFCLASPSCEQHLIAGVGSSLYMALPKGAMLENHILVVPIAHEPCCAVLCTEDLDEVNKYMGALTRMLDVVGQVPLVFERNIVFGKAAQRHAYLEVVPIPKERVEELDKVLHREAKRCGLELEELDSPDTSAGATAGDGNNDKKQSGTMSSGLEALQSAVQGDASVEYYFVRTPSGQSFMHRIDPDRTSGVDGPRLPTQFGRLVACRLFGTMNRVDWRNCVENTEKETEQATVFKEQWKAFDPDPLEDSD